MSDESPNGFVPDPRIREYPGTYIRDWIMLCPDISDAAYRAYSIIRAHIWEKDEKREVRLTQAQIAEMLTKSEDHTRKKILKPLLAVGLLRVAEKREWWEYNSKLKRQERRTMNIYAVTDFPGEDYEGPKSMSDFKARFASQPKTGRAKMTGRVAVPVSAGQTDRAETTGRSSPQDSDVSAGQTDRAKMTSPAVKNTRPYKKPFQEQEGEEGDARAGASPDPVEGDNPVWGVQGGAGFAVPTLESAELVRDIAGKALLPGESLSGEEHQRLAALVQAARPVVEAQAGLSWEEYEAWLRQGWVRADGRRTFNAFAGTLAWRLLPEQVRGQAWAWACERRASEGPSEAQGVREPQAPKNAPHEGTCAVHRVKTLGGVCLPCQTEAAAEERRLQEEERRARQEQEDAEAAAAAGEDSAPEEEPEEDPEVMAEIARSLKEAEEKAAQEKESALQAYRRQQAERERQKAEEAKKLVDNLRAGAERDRLQRAF